MDYRQLKRKIRIEYDSQNAFAMAINWHRNKVSAMVTGKYIPDVDEAADISKALHLSVREHYKIFCA